MNRTGKRIIATTVVTAALLSSAVVIASIRTNKRTEKMLDGYASV